MVNHKNGGIRRCELETLNLFQFCQDAYYSWYKSPVWKQKRKENRGHENSAGGYLRSFFSPASLPRMEDIEIG